MGNIETSLLENLKNDLDAIASNKELFKKTQDRLNQYCEDHSDTMNVADLEEVFEDCYHELVSLEKEGSLTVKQIELLTDLDELEDYLVHRK